MKRITILFAALLFSSSLLAQDTIENYIKEFPNQEQVKMMTAWLDNNEAGTFQFTGLVDPTDATVVTPQATVDYGYNWFSLTDGPAVIHTPQYDRFFSVSIFDMKHNVPAVIVHPEIPILLIRPGQPRPAGEYHVVNLETDQGLAFTRMVVVENMDEVRQLSKSIRMDGGTGEMRRDVQRFSPEIEDAALAIISMAIPYLSVDTAFGERSGDVGEISLAGGVLQGQLGTPPGSVRYFPILSDEEGKPLTGDDTYVLTIPAGIVHDNGYYSITAYGSENMLLIPNDKKVYDRTTYSSERNEDGTYTVTLSPSGEGLNGIPTGRPFYAVLRAYIPVEGADLTVAIEKQ